MKLLKWSPLFTLALVCASFAPLPATQPAAVATAPNWLTLVGLYPQLGTMTSQEEVAILLWLQGSRTAQDVARAQSETTPSFGCFVGDIHLGGAAGASQQPIQISDFPKTEAVLDQARQDILPILESLQNTYLRPHPAMSFPAVTPVVRELTTYSYPSTNATLGVLFAQILGQWDQPDRPAFSVTGNLLGTDRVLGGVHYPSDSDAGQRLGLAFASWWIDSHLALIQTACPEWNQN
jgi:acid phosphatase (class A)